MEYQNLRNRVRELSDEIESIKAENAKHKRGGFGFTRESAENRRLRLEEIKQELHRLASKGPPNSP
ncbi:MAG: hypothetical protein JWO91_2865 [Acidobacteriaceae bacterium]|jgi:hypothetical protein|nr:hypothetical protein [Acidobacteriaceae bacterium]